MTPAANMRRAAAILVAAIVLAGAPAAPAAAAEVNFDSFLGAIERCRMNKNFAAFFQANVKKFGNDAKATGEIVRAHIVVPIPARVRAGVGEAVSKNEGEFTSVSIPISGTYRGLPARTLSLVIGNENDTAGWAIHFSTPRDNVVRKFRSVIAASNRARPANVPGRAGIGEGDSAILSCDLTP